jgi:hypothetical protein
MYLDAEEQKCVRWIAQMFDKNERYINRRAAMEALGANDQEYEKLMRRMASLGVLENVKYSSNQFALMFSPAALSVDVVRELDQPRPAAPPPDVVERIRARARSKPALAWIIVAIVAIVFLATGLNAIIDLWRKLLGGP